MTTDHDKDKIIAAANECHHLYSEWNIDIERFYAIAFEDGRQAVRVAQMAAEYYVQHSTIATFIANDIRARNME